MDSSELTKFRRNRTEANSNNGQKTTKPANKITQMSASSALNIFLGGRKIMFDKRTILPNCQAPTCIIDEGTQVEPEPILLNGWVTNIDGSTDTTAQSVTVDKINGDFIYVTGNFVGLNLTGALDVRNHVNVTAGIINTSSFGSMDVSSVLATNTLEYVAKYDTNGDAVWATYINMNNGGAKARSIKTDSSGDVYVTLDVEFFAGQTLIDSIEFYDFVNVTSGTINTLLVGTLSFPNSQNNESDIILVKYNSVGQVQWVTSIGNVFLNIGGENEFESSLTIDSSDNIYVSGAFRNRTLINSADPLTSTITLTPYAILAPPGIPTQNFRNIGFIAKYDINGLALGATLIGGGGGNGGHSTVITCIDSDGTDIFVSGVSSIGGVSTSTILQFYDFNGLTINPFPPPVNAINLTATGTLQDFTNTQPFLAKYNASLQFQWGLRVDGTSNNQGQVASVSTSSDGVFITGFYSTPLLAPYNILSTGPTPSIVGILPPNGPLAGFIIKYNKLNGTFIWATTFAGTTQLSRGFSLATDSSNNVIVTGESTDPSMTVNSFNGFAGLNILLAPFGTLTTSGPVRKVFIIKYGSNGQVQWATFLDENPPTSVVATPTSFSISTDSSDDIIICGKYSEPLVFRSYQSTTPSTNPVNTIMYGTLPIIDEQGSTAYLAKYDKTGVVV